MNAIAPIAYTRMLAQSVESAGQPTDAAAQAVLDDLVAQYLQKLEPGLVAPVARSKASNSSNNRAGSMYCTWHPRSTMICV